MVLLAKILVCSPVLFKSSIEVSLPFPLFSKFVLQIIIYWNRNGCSFWNMCAVILFSLFICAVFTAWFLSVWFGLCSVQGWGMELTIVSWASHSRVCLPYVWCHNVCGMKELQNSEVKSMEPSESAEFWYRWIVIVLEVTLGVSNLWF